MNTINHAQARQLIEQPPVSLTREAWVSLQQHLETCEDCRTYRTHYLQRDQTIKQALQAQIPRPHFSTEHLRKISNTVHRRAQFHRRLISLMGSIRTLTWAGLTAAMIFALGWVIQNTNINTPEPAATAVETSEQTVFLFPTPTEVPILPTDAASPTSLPPNTPTPAGEVAVPLSPPPPPLSPQYRITLSASADRVTSVAFSPDGDMLVSGSVDGFVYAWRVSDGTLLYSLPAHAKAVTSLAFSPDGQTLSTGGKDGKVNQWLAQSGAFIRTLVNDPGWVKSLSYSPSGHLLAVSLNEYRVMIINTVNGMSINSTSGYTRFDVSTATYNNYVLASSETAVWLDDSSKLPFGLKIRGQGGKSLDAVYSSTVNLMASGSTDQKIYLWQIYDVSYIIHQNEQTPIEERQVFGPLQMVLEGHTGWVNGVAFSPDGQYLVSGSGDTTLIIWNLDGEPVATLTGHTAGVNDVAISPDGTLIASASDDGTVKLWSLEP